MHISLSAVDLYFTLAYVSHLILPGLPLLRLLSLASQYPPSPSPSRRSVTLAFLVLRHGQSTCHFAGLRPHSHK